MSDLEFQEEDGFDANVEAFLTHMEAIDAALGPILRTHLPLLANGGRDATSAFNAAVGSSLEGASSSDVSA